jgi:type I restriction enzyme S subunit
MVPILRAGNIADVLDTTADLVWVPSARVKPNQHLQLGDIAICMSSGSQTVVGKSAPLRRDWLGSVGAFCAIVRPKPEVVDPAYLALYMRSDGFRSWTRTSEGANIKNIRHSELLTHRVPVPPLDEQRRVVELLSRAENIVRMRREAEATAEKVIPALFVNMFEGRREAIPLGRLGDVIFEFRYGSSQKSTPNGCPVLRIPNVVSGHIDTTDLKFLEVSEADQVRYRLHDGDILFVRTNGNPDYVGRCSTFEPPDDRNWIFASYLIRARPRMEKVDPTFLQAVLASNSGRSQLRENARTAAGQYNINIDGLRGIRIPVPSLEAQRLFAGRAHEIRTLSTQQRLATETAEQTLQSLLARVFQQ